MPAVGDRGCPLATTLNESRNRPTSTVFPENAAEFTPRGVRGRTARSFPFVRQRIPRSRPRWEPWIVAPLLPLRPHYRSQHASASEAGEGTTTLMAGSTTMGGPGGASVNGKESGRANANANSAGVAGRSKLGNGGAGANGSVIVDAAETAIGGTVVGVASVAGLLRSSLNS